MSTKFYFQSVEISNFRAFKHLKIDRLKRLNLIGGFNGVGKTAFLESLFFFLDRRSPIAMLKPLSWRKIENQGPLDVAQFLHNQDSSDAFIQCRTRTDVDRLILSHTNVPHNISLSIATGGAPAGFGTVDTSKKGMSIRLIRGSDTLEEYYLLPSEAGAVGNVAKASNVVIPQAQILSIANRGLPQEVGQRLSTLVKSRRTQTLVDALKQLIPNLGGLQTLHEGGAPQVYAEVGSDFLPVQLLGDGFQNLFQTVLGIMTARDGVLLLDEIDAALHYSKIPAIWSVIAKLAEAENCQIFATTHSRECINSAADGVRSAGRHADFQYLRFEKTSDGNHQAIPYSIDEVKNAELSDVEIR